MSEVTIRCRACNRAFQFQRQSGDFTVECPHCLRQLKIKSKDESGKPESSVDDSEVGEHGSGISPEPPATEDSLPKPPIESGKPPGVDRASAIGDSKNDDRQSGDGPVESLLADPAQRKWIIIGACSGVVFLLLIFLLVVFIVGREPDSATGWARLLVSGNAGQVEKAKQVLATIEDPDGAIPDLLSSDEPEVRELAIELIKSRKSDDAKSISSVLECWEKFPDSRTSLQDCLAEVGVPAIEPVLEFPETEPAFSEASAFGILDSIQEDITPALSEILNSDEAAGKAKAARYLQQRPEMIQRFAGKQLGEQRIVELPKTIAVLSLAYDPHGTARVQLEKKLDDPDLQVDFEFWNRLHQELGENGVGSLVELADRNEPDAWRVGLEGLDLFATNNADAAMKIADVALFSSESTKQDFANTLLHNTPPEIAIQALLAVAAIRQSEDELVRRLAEKLEQEFERGPIGNALTEILEGSERPQIVLTIQIVVTLGDHGKLAHPALEGLAATNDEELRKLLVVAFGIIDPGAIERLGLEGTGYSIHVRAADAADYDSGGRAIKLELLSFKDLPANLRDVVANVVFIRTGSGLPDLKSLEEFSFDGDAKLSRQDGSTYVQSTLVGENESNGGFFIKVSGDCVAELLNSLGVKAFQFEPQEGSSLESSVVDFSEPGTLYFAFSVGDPGTKKERVLSNTVILDVK